MILTRLGVKPESLSSGETDKKYFAGVFNIPVK